MTVVVDTAHFDQQILDRLETVQPAAAVYDLEVPGSPAMIPNQPGRVRPYLVYQASGPGQPTQVELAEEGDSVVLRPIVKCVAAYRHDVVNLVAHTRAMLEHWSPTAPDGLNVAVSRLAFPVGFSPGNVSIDRGETPARPWLLLQYAYTVST